MRATVAACGADAVFPERGAFVFVGAFEVADGAGIVRAEFALAVLRVRTMPSALGTDPVFVGVLAGFAAVFAYRPVIGEDMGADFETVDAPALHPCMFGLHPAVGADGGLRIVREVAALVAADGTDLVFVEDIPVLAVVGTGRFAELADVVRRKACVDPFLMFTDDAASMALPPVVGTLLIHKIPDVVFARNSADVADAVGIVIVRAGETAIGAVKLAVILFVRADMAADGAVPRTAAAVVLVFVIGAVETAEDTGIVVVEFV